jgi:hypothetical protein
VGSHAPSSPCSRRPDSRTDCRRRLVAAVTRFGVGPLVSGARCLAAGKLAAGQHAHSSSLFFVGTNSSTVRFVWPRACRRWGCVRGHRAGARLPLLRASPGTAPHGVAATVTCWLVRASHYRGRVREWLHAVWRRPATSLHLVLSLGGARLPLSRASPGTAPRGVAAAGKAPLPPASRRG